MTETPPVILGAMNILNPYRSKETTIEEEKEMITAYLDAFPGGWIDTAYYYGNGFSQARLGAVLADLSVARPRIASKVNPWWGNDFSSGRLGALGGEALRHQIVSTAKALRAPRSDDAAPAVDLMFLHAWDSETPIAETMRVMGDYYRRERYFRDWGLSNVAGPRIGQAIEAAETEGLPRPTVYQGLYNRCCRRIEEIFPILETESMKFWAYNPLCGGSLVREPSISKPGRFQNPVYQSIFGGVTLERSCLEFRSALPTVQQRLSAALGWYQVGDECRMPTTKQNSSVILGATTLDQLQGLLEAWKTPLDWTTTRLPEPEDDPPYFYE